MAVPLSMTLHHVSSNQYLTSFVSFNVSEFSHHTPIDSVTPLLYEAFAVHLDLENIETVIWPGLHPCLNRNKYLGIARALPKPFCQVMIFESLVEIHSPSLFLYDDVPFFGCADGNHSIHIIELQTGRIATMQFRDYPGFERTVGTRSHEPNL